MFRRQRLKKIHAKFLESCRNLREGRTLWEHTGVLQLWFLQLIAPIPLLGLHDDGKVLLEALEWLEANCRTKLLGEQVIRHYHKLVYMKNDEQGGVYRRHEIVMEESAIKRRHAQRVIPAMKALDVRLAREQRQFDGEGQPSQESILRTAVEIHHQIGLIHPFADANGRVARLSMNHFLRRYGAGYVIYPPMSESKEMWESLQAAHRGDLDTLVNFAKRHVMDV